MEMIMISPSQLKVMMDADDMKKYELDCGEGLCAGISRRSALRSILKKAWEQTGFLSDGRRVVVKMFPSKDGGCEMFVTRLGDVEAHGDIETKRGCTTVRDGMPVYSFPSFLTLSIACRRLKETGYRDDSAAYRYSDGQKYYLAISRVSPIVSEMGGALVRSGAIAYINEYCTLICEDAVGVLSEYV